MDNENKEKIVDFEKYCKECKFFNVDDSKGEEPCNSCLAEPVNENSRKPVNFEPAEEKEKKEE